jgi:hypothetical protein
MSVRNSISILTVAINGGEDYELLLPLLWKILIKLKPNFSIIGHMTGKVKESI